MQRSRSEFILDAATSEAIEVLLNRQPFELDARAFKELAEALDTAPAANPRLRKFLTKAAPWER